MPLHYNICGVCITYDWTLKTHCKKEEQVFFSSLRSLLLWIYWGSFVNGKICMAYLFSYIASLTWAGAKKRICKKIHCSSQISLSLYRLHSARCKWNFLHRTQTSFAETKNLKWKLYVQKWTSIVLHYHLEKWPLVFFKIPIFFREIAADRTFLSRIFSWNADRSFSYWIWRKK